MKYLYKIQIQPSQEISTYVRQCKQYIHHLVGRFKFITSDPHISLISFEADTSNEAQLIRALRKTAALTPAININLNGFDTFPIHNTLYINIENEKQLNHTIRQLYTDFVGLTTDGGISLNSRSCTSKPHLTIGSGFDHPDFHLVKNAFLPHPYHRSCATSQLLLLKYNGKGQNKLITRAPLSKEMQLNAI